MGRALKPRRSTEGSLMIRIRPIAAAPAVNHLRVCALACVLLAAGAGPAAADERSTAAVAKLVRAHIAASIKTEGAFLGTLTDDAHVTTPEGAPDVGAIGCRDSPDACGAPFNLYEHTTDILGSFKYASIGKPAIYVDDANHVAFFQVAVKLSVDGSRGEEMDVDVRGKTTMRLTGIAVDQQGAWKIAAIAYAPSITDRRLADEAERPDGQRFAPRKAVTKEVMSWVGHLADHISPRAIGAAGTAPKEFATKPAAIAQLARTWDKLPLDITYLEAIEHGNAAFLWGTAYRKVGPKAAALVPIILVEKDGSGWKWIAISWVPRQMFEASLGR